MIEVIIFDRMTDTLDILEECLLTIYTVRKESLQYRILKGRQNKNRSIQTPKKSSSRNFLLIDEDIAETDDIQKQANIKTGSSNSSCSPIDTNKNWILGEPGLLKDVKEIPIEMTIKTVKEETKPPVTSSNTEEKTTSLPQDSEAQIAFDDFCREIDRWWNDSSLQTKDNDEERELFADYLCDKYMCQRLDPLPPSKTVTQIRKNISKIIDDFAMKGELSPDVQQYKTRSKRNVESSSANVKSLKQKLEGQSNSKDNKISSKSGIDNTKLDHDTSKGSTAVPIAVNKAQGDTSSKDSNISIEQVVAAKGVAKTQVDKREQEKQKIKEQYEAYMKMKSKTESHPDTTKTKQYEENLDDIKNLLSSIRAPLK